MLKRALILSIFALTQTGCSLEEGVGAYKPVPITEKVREELEGLKRDFLKIEELKVGDGPLLSGVERSEPTLKSAIPMTRSLIIAPCSYTPDS